MSYLGFFITSLFIEDRRAAEPTTLTCMSESLSGSTREIVSGVFQEPVWNRVTGMTVTPLNQGMIGAMEDLESRVVTDVQIVPVTCNLEKCSRCRTVVKDCKCGLHACYKCKTLISEEGFDCECDEECNICYNSMASCECSKTLCTCCKNPLNYCVCLKMCADCEWPLKLCKCSTLVGQNICDCCGYYDSLCKCGCECTKLCEDCQLQMIDCQCYENYIENRNRKIDQIFSHRMHGTCWQCGYESWECHCSSGGCSNDTYEEYMYYSPEIDTSEEDYYKYLNPPRINTCIHCNKRSICTTDTNKYKSNCSNTCRCNEICSACETPMSECECEYVSDSVVNEEIENIVCIERCVSSRICDNIKIPTYVVLELDIIKSEAIKFMVSKYCTIPHSLLSKYKHRLAIVIAFRNLPDEILNAIMKFVCSEVENPIYNIGKLPVF